MTENIMEVKNCKKCSISFDITDKDLDFYKKVSPIFNEKKYPIPSPSLCPDCRQQRRCSHVNNRSVYGGKCEFSGKTIVSMYSPDKVYKVYNISDWWSDKWNPLDYSLNYDFKQNSFQQFNSLEKEVPQLSMINDNNVSSENCEFTNNFAFGKNCYLVNASWNIENCMYSHELTDKSDNVIDSSRITQSHNIYECINCDKLANCKYLQNSENSRDCSYGYDIMGCENCFMCYGLRNKKYFIENVEYKKEDYFIKIKKLRLITRLDDFLDFIKDFPRKHLNIKNCEDCTGDLLINSKKCYETYDVAEGYDCKYFYEGDAPKTSQDIIQCGKCELCYDSITPDNSYKCCFTIWCWKCSDILYSNNCHSCKNLFFCTGLKNQQYCILNKQYTKEQYNEIVPKIIEHMIQDGEWGELFPSNLSPFGYNETVASEYFPLNRIDVTQRPVSGETGLIAGDVFNWSDYESPAPVVKKIIKAKNLPDNIKDIPDDILNWAVECEVTNKPFRIQKQELEFYRKNNLPIPKRHPDQRHLDRMSLRNPRKLYDRKCDKCQKDVKTTYSSDRNEIVYCQKCYNKEIY